MIALFHAPLPPVKDEHLKSDASMEFREAVLNHRLLDGYYAQLRASNVEEFRRLKQSDSGE